MKIIIAGTEEQRTELDAPQSEEITWVTSPEQIHEHAGGADAYIDLLFDGSAVSVERLEKLDTPVVVVNSVIKNLDDLDETWIRINGWTSFLSSDIIEGAAHETQRSAAEGVFEKLGKKIQWTPDIHGFITPRVICMIINEAYFALADEVSTKSDIDTAMKFGTAYPYGPFEWAKKIGLKNICALLSRLETENKRYAPAPLLVTECENHSD